MLYCSYIAVLSTWVYSSVLKMDIVTTSETFITFYQITEHHIPEIVVFITMKSSDLIPLLSIRKSSLHGIPRSKAHCHVQRTCNSSHVSCSPLGIMPYMWHLLCFSLCSSVGTIDAGKCQPIKLGGFPAVDGPLPFVESLAGYTP